MNISVVSISKIVKSFFIAIIFFSNTGLSQVNDSLKNNIIFANEYFDDGNDKSIINKGLSSNKIAFRNKDMVIGLVDDFTHEFLTFTKVTKFVDGTMMDDSKVDSVIYRKKGTEYFKRNFTTDINIKWFGVISDKGYDNINAFQKAINITSLLRGQLYIPSGSYQISNTIRLKPNILIHGDGMLKTKIIANAKVSPFNIFEASHSNCDYITFMDLSIVNDMPGSTDNENIGNSVFFGSSNNPVIGCKFIRCGFFNSCAYGLKVSSQTDIRDPSSLIESDITIRECYFKGCRLSNLLIKGVAKVVVEHNTITNAGNYGAIISLASYASIVSNQFNDNGKDGIVCTYISDASIQANQCNNNGQWGIAMGGGSNISVPNFSYSVMENKCHNNLFGGITNDPTINNIKFPQDVNVTLIGNICSGSKTFHGIYFHNVRYFTCGYNICFDNKNSGIAFDGQYGIVSNNQSYNNKKYGLAIFVPALADSTLSSKYGGLSVLSNLTFNNDSSNVYFGTNSNKLLGLNVEIIGEESPEGEISAPAGVQYVRINKNDRSLFVKKTNNGKNGWLQITNNEESPDGNSNNLSGNNTKLFANTVTAKNFSITSEDLVFLNHEGENSSVSLPSASSNKGRIIWIKNLNKLNNVQIVGLAEGEISIIKGRESFQISSDGKAWYLINKL